MITKNDALLLLSDLQDNGIQTKDAIKELMASRDVPISVLQFINKHRQLDLTGFYEKLRKSYNDKHSKLYISIIKEVQNPEDVLTTLSLDDLSCLIKNKKISTNNVDLIFGAEDTLVSDYLKQRLGYNGFVLGIIGQISNATMEKLVSLDPELKNKKVALEIQIPENDALFMSVEDLVEVADFIDLGLDKDDIIEQIDTAIQNGTTATNKIVCIPYIPSLNNFKLLRPVSSSASFLAT